MTTITLTGDNNYSGTYDSSIWGSMYVLGGANDGGHDDTDAITGNEVFVFGNLQHKSTTVTDATYDGTGTLVDGSQGTTFQTTASGTSNDTMHFDFTLHHGAPGGTLTFQIPDGSPDADGDANYQTDASASGVTNSYNSWVASLPAGYTLNNDPVTVETGVHTEGPDHTLTDPDVNVTLAGITATAAGTPDTLTADHGGDKTLLGFSVGSDHIALDGVTDESMFDTYFTVNNAATHQSANNNTVHDTTITLNGGSWSVDLYGVDLSAMSQADAAHYVYTNVVAHS